MVRVPGNFLSIAMKIKAKCVVSVPTRIVGPTFRITWLISLAYLLTLYSYPSEKAVLIVDLDSGLPQANLAVNLIDNTGSRALQSDLDGWFRFDDRGSNQNSFEVHFPRSSYQLPYDVEAPEPRRFPLWFHGQIAVLPVVKTSSISGQVFHSDGTPISGMRILAAQRSADGESLETFEPSSSVLTDDEGKYHISGLTKGAYVIAALAAGTVAQSASHGVTYYPDARESRDAWEIHLDQKSDIDGINLRVQETALSSVMVKFPSVPATHLADSVSVWLTPQQSIATALQGGIVPPEGEYLFPSVASGNYYLLASATPTRVDPNSTPGEGAMFAKVALTIAPGERVELALVPERPIVVKATLDNHDSASDTCAAPKALLLRPESVWPSNWIFRGRLTRGSVVWKSLPPGAYRLEMSPSQIDCEVSLSRAQPSGSTLRPTVLLANNSEFSIKLTRPAGTITGRVEGRSLPIVGASIILVSVSAPAPVQYATTQKDGTFSFSGQRSGRYVVLAGVLPAAKLPETGTQPALHVRQLVLSRGEHLDLIMKLDDEDATR
jgi:hypothetical protein